MEPQQEHKYTPILQPARLQLMSVDISVDISVPAAEIQIRAESLEMNPA